MISVIKEWFKNPEAEDLNLNIMNRKYEEPLETHVLDGFLSIEETLEQVKMVDHQFVTDFDKISITEYEQDRSKPNSKQPKAPVAYINNSRLGELTMHFDVDLSSEPVAHTEAWRKYLDKKLKDRAPKNPLVLHYVVRELVPIADPEDGSYLLKGNRYVSQYQLTETTTYNTSNALVLKSIMGIKLEKRKIEAKDHEGNTCVLNSWRCNLMSQMTPVMYFFLSEYGWADTLESFMVGDLIDLYQGEAFEHGFMYFHINQDLYLKVREMAMNSSYVQGIVGSLLAVLNSKVTVEEINSNDYWIAQIGATKKGTLKSIHYEMGRRYRILFKRMLDKGSKKVYRLTMHNKRSVLHVIRWMIQEYAILRSRDNLDISYKRLRGNEYIASLITGIISDRIRKFVHTMANTPEKLLIKYDNLFKYRGTEVINRLHKSGLVKGDDIVNDLNDLFLKFAATAKGPNALGNNNPRNITMRQRGIHPSHIGKISIGECSASDPGRSAYICPLAQTDGLFFKDTPPEPESFAYNFKREMGAMTEWTTEDGTVILSITDPVKFNNVIDIIDEFNISQLGKEETNE